MANKYVGIDLGSHQVKLALVKGGLRTSRLVETVIVPLDEEQRGGDPLDAGISAAIATLRERGWSGLPASVAMPGGATSFRVVKLPFSDPKRVAQVIGFELDGQFPVPLEELEYDHVVSAIAGGGAAALVTAVRREQIDEIVARFRNGGVDVRMITTGPLAVAQVAGGGLMPSTSDDDRTPVALVLDIGHRETGLIALAEKGPVAARTLRRGGRDLTQALREAYGLDFAQAETAKHRDGFVLHATLEGLSDEQRRSGEVLAGALDRTLREIEHTRRWLDAELRCEVTELRLVGGGSLTSGLDAFLEERTALPCHGFTGHASARILGVSPESWATHATAIGAAMGAAKRPLVQLYDPIADQGGGGWVQERFGTVATLGIAITAFAAVDTIVELNALEQERDRHEAELVAATESVFGDPLHSAAEVEARLSSVEGADLTSMLPDRGALDVLAMISKAATPKTLPVTEPLALDPNLGGPGAPPKNDGSPVYGPAGQITASPAVIDLAPVAPDAGIVADDDLVIAQIDIRELVIDLQLSATRATAQDRLKLKLTSELPCISEVMPGKIRDQRERKMFTMKLDHLCFRADKEEE
ncbi:MAG: hypothetical protein B7733_20735 [Myxococcales bacterium FL481]|nr:MAG: hypothetical protein B7733_20735 [Myxococcales bacterium FL481]